MGNLILSCAKVICSAVALTVLQRAIDYGVDTVIYNLQKFGEEQND